MSRSSQRARKQRRQPSVTSSKSKPKEPRNQRSDSQTAPASSNLNWKFYLVAAAFLCIAMAVAWDAVAEEADVPSVIEEVTEESEDEAGLTDRIKRAFKYATSGDSSEIVSEADQDLETSRAELNALRADLDQEKADFDAAVDRFERAQEEFHARTELLNECLRHATGEENVSEG